PGRCIRERAPMTTFGKVDRACAPTPVGGDRARSRATSRKELRHRPRIVNEFPASARMLTHMDSDFPTYGELATSADWQTTAAVELGDARPTERYTEGAVLGVGGMGKVVAARDARIGRDVAIKVLHADR